MSCLITRNNSGKITEVRTPNNESSKLFQAIHSNVFMGDAESSVEILAAAYSPQMEEKFAQGENTYDTGEPRLYLKSSKGQEFDSLEEMVIAEELGLSSIGFKDPQTNEFIPIAKFDTNSSEKNKFLTGQIQQGILSAERVLQEDGITRFQGKGNFPEVRKMMSQAAKFEAIMELGNGRTKVNKDGTFEIEFIKDTTIVERAEGSQIIEVKDIPLISEDASVQNRAELIMQYELLVANEQTAAAYVKDTDTTPIINSLYSFLESMGFTLSSLEEYRKNYNTKYGKDPDILALTDMANKVVALGQGIDVTEELTEEVAHIAIEAYSEQASIAGALAVVHLTPEYTQHSEYYREKYAAFSEGIELEDKVRKEILGKVLARQIKEKFDTQNKSAEETTLIEKLRDLFTKFVQSIQSVFRPHHGQALNKLTNSIAETFLKKDFSQFDKAFESDNFFYSAMPQEAKKIEADLKAAKGALEDLFTTVLKKGVPRKGELDRIIDEMDEVEILSSVNTIAGIAKNQVQVLEANVRTANERGIPVESIDSLRYANLKAKTIPILNSIKVQLEAKIKPGENRFKNDKHIPVALSTIKVINEVILTNTGLDPLMDLHYESVVERIHKEALEDTNLSEEEKENELRLRKESIKDTTWLGSLFSPISHSRDALLQLMYRSVIKMNTIINNQFKSAADKAVNEIYDKGWQKFQKDIIQKDEEGKATHYYTHFVRQDKYDKDLKALEIKLIGEFSGKTEDQITKLLEKQSAEDIIGNIDKVIQYREQLRKQRQTLDENRNTDAYEIERERVLTKAGIDENSPTRVVIANKNKAFYQRNSKYRNADGIIDKTRQTEADKLEDAADYQSYLSSKSAFDMIGNLREGLQRLKIQDLSAEQLASLPAVNVKDFKGEVTVLEEGFTKENLDEDALVALELSHMDLVYFEESKDETRSNKAGEAFKKQLLEAEANGEAFDFVSSNATFAISSDYYESIGQGATFMDVAQKFVKDIPVEADKNIKQDILDDLKELQQARKELLKRYKKQKNPTETDVNSMGGMIQDRIIALDEDIAQRRKDLKLPSSYYEQMTIGKKSTRELSEDFYLAQRQSGLSVLDFCFKHMTKTNTAATYDFMRGVTDLMTERTNKVKPAYVEFTNQVRETYSEEEWKSFGSAQKKEIYVEAFAKNRVTSYYQKNTPVGFKSAMEAIKRGDLLMSDVMDETKKASLLAEYPGLEVLEIIPDYAWTQNISDNPYANPRYKADGHRTQPNIDKYWNPQMTELYGITKEEFIEKGDDLNLYTPTKNKEQFEFLKTIINIRSNANKSLTGSVQGDMQYNKFQRAQMSQTVAERTLQVLHGSIGGNIKNTFKDLTQNRIDEKEYGETLYSDVTQEIRVVPKYFQSKLEDPNEITDNVIQAELMNLKEAIRYEQRTQIEDDINALMFSISQRAYTASGGSLNRQKIVKKEELSRFYAQAKEYRDYQLYGVKESMHMETEILGQRVDLTQVVNMFQGFVRFKNLAFNPLVDLTGATTGAINNMLDRTMQDYYHSSSFDRGFGISKSKIGKYIAESGKVNKTSEMNHWLEFFQVEETSSRLENTGYGRGIRAMFKSHFALSKMSNMSITPDILFAILCDYRVVDGKFMTWTEFKGYKKNENKDLSKTEMEAAWSKHKKESLYDHITVTKEGIKYNEKFEALYKNKGEAREAFDKLQIRVISKSKQVIQNVDGVLNESDQVGAQRNFLTNMLMMHKGWLSIMLTRRFKRRHLNLQTGQYEEGHYTTLFNFLGNIIQKKKNAQSLKDIWDNMEEDQRRNFWRTTIETGFGMALLALGSLIFAGAEGDDEKDDTYLGNLAQLIYLRTVSEYNSTQIYAMHGSIIDTVKSPVVAMTSIEDITKTPGKALDAMTGGKDAEFYKHLAKLFITKRYYQVGGTSQLREQINSYRHFNETTLFNLASGK